MNGSLRLSCVKGTRLSGFVPFAVGSLLLLAAGLKTHQSGKKRTSPENGAAYCTEIHDVPILFGTVFDRRHKRLLPSC